jgi:hypothetical protein
MKPSVMSPNIDCDAISLAALIPCAFAAKLRASGRCVGTNNIRRPGAYSATRKRQGAEYTSEGVTQQLVQLPVEAERLKVKFVSINID